MSAYLEQTPHMRNVPLTYISVCESMSIRSLMLMPYAVVCTSTGKPFKMKFLFFISIFFLSEQTTFLQTEDRLSDVCQRCDLSSDLHELWPWRGDKGENSSWQILLHFWSRYLRDYPIFCDKRQFCVVKYSSKCYFKQVPP